MACTKEEIKWTMDLIKDNEITAIHLTSSMTPDIEDFFNSKIDGDDVAMHTKIAIELKITKWPKSPPPIRRQSNVNDTTK